MQISSTADRRAVLLRRGLLLEYVTLGWNIVGTAIVVAAAISARSVALAGFGLDSLIEIFASVVVVWQLKGTDRNRERAALRLIALAFLGVAVYVLVQSAYTPSVARGPARRQAAWRGWRPQSRSCCSLHGGSTQPGAVSTIKC
jgi:hypothetical protein